MVIDLNHPWPYLLTAAFVAVVGLVALKQPRRPGAYYFNWMVGLWFVWALTAAIGTVVKSLTLLYLLWIIESICALLISPFAVMFSLEYMGNDKWLNWRTLALLAVPAFIFVLLAIFLPSNIFVSNEVQYGVPVILMNDIAEGGILTVNIAIWLISLGVLIDGLLRAPASRAPIMLILLGQIFIRIAYVVFDSQQSNLQPAQAITLFSNFTILTYFIALYHYKILQITPVAHDVAMNHMPYGVIVLDAENRVVDLNLAAQRLPELSGKLGFRQPANQLLGSWWDRISTMIGTTPVSKEVILQTDTRQIHFDVQSIPLLQSSGWRIGQVFVFEDITDISLAQQQKMQIMWAQATLQEREQLANELHDSLSQSLAFLNLQAQTAQLYLQSGQDEAVEDCLSRLVEAAIQLQEDTRELISNLLSVSMPAENFCVTLRQLLTNFEKHTGLSIHLKINGDANVLTRLETFFDPSQLAPPVAVQLIRITQEALTNIRKHAKGASKVNVQLEARNGHLLLIIKDDGAGFDPNKQQASGNHFGLQVMRQRAERIGGKIAIDSVPGKGTRLEICASFGDGKKGAWDENSSSG